MYSDTRPRLGDSDNNLLGKILEVLGGLAQPGDSDVDLLFRILTQLNSVDLSGASDLFVLKSGSTMTGDLTVPNLAATGNITSAGPVAFGTGLVATVQCTIQDALNSTLLFVNNVKTPGGAAGSGGNASLVLRSTTLGSYGWRIANPGSTDQLEIQDEGAQTNLIVTAARNLVINSVSTVQPTNLAKGLVIADGTAASADPTTASAVWSVSGALQYRTSGASEGSGQTNFLHNRSAEQAGVGTNYTLTNATAHVVFGTTNADISLPTAGTYLVMANVEFIAGTTAGDIYSAKLRNSSDSTDIGVNKRHTQETTTAARFNIHLEAIVTITAAKNVQIFAFNETGTRGSVESTTTDIRYIRLS